MSQMFSGQVHFSVVASQTGWEMSDGGDAASDEYVPFRDRPDWADVEPLVAEEGPEPVVSIE